MEGPACNDATFLELVSRMMATAFRLLRSLLEGTRSTEEKRRGGLLAFKQEK